MKKTYSAPELQVELFDSVVMAVIDDGDDHVEVISQPNLYDFEAIG